MDRQARALPGPQERYPRGEGLKERVRRAQVQLIQKDLGIWEKSRPKFMDVGLKMESSVTKWLDGTTRQKEKCSLSQGKHGMAWKGFGNVTKSTFDSSGMDKA